MNPASSRFRFIPYRLRDVLALCREDGRFAGKEREFSALGELLTALYRHESQRTIDTIDEIYARVDPDHDTRRLTRPNDTTPDSATFARQLEHLLESANFERITEDDLNQAFLESSLFKIRLHVDFDAFAEILLFCRGESIRTETIPTWFGLRSKTITFTNYDRVVVYLRFRDDYQPAKNQLPTCKPGSTLLKLFQNVPKADLEMLFPNTRILMRTIDKLIIGVPAVIGGGIVLTTKLGASLLLLASLAGFWLGLNAEPIAINRTAIIALLAGLGALGSFFWKQFNTFKNRKLQFMETLTRNLYFKNLDNNAGVFHRLAQDAGEEECKEAILAYSFLLEAAEPLTAAQLDASIERWFEQKHDCVIDFEVDDALRKLVDLGLLRDAGDGRVSAVPIEDALDILNRRWDDLFSLPST